MPSRSPPVRVGPRPGRPRDFNAFCAQKYCRPGREDSGRSLAGSPPAPRSYSEKLHPLKAATRGVKRDFNPQTGFGGCSPTPIQTRLEQQIHRASTRSFLLLTHLPDFSALPYMSIASPLPHPAIPLLTGWADLSSSWPLRADPAGRLTSLRAPGPAATRPRSRWSRRLLPHPFPRPRPRPSAHGSAPRVRNSRTLPQDHVPVWGHVRSRFSGHVANQCLRSLAHAWRSCPHATALPLGHVPISSSRPPGHVPPPHSQSRPMHAMHCSDWGSAAHGSLHGAKLEARSWSCVACWHAAALFSRRRAGPSSRAAGIIAGWSCG